VPGGLECRDEQVRLAGDPWSTLRVNLGRRSVTWTGAVATGIIYDAATHVSQNRVHLAVVGLVLVATCVLGLVPRRHVSRTLHPVLPGWKFQDSYRALRLGMTKAEADRAFRSPCGLRVHVSGFEVRYYLRPKPFWGLLRMAHRTRCRL
jgi:hypothetical protein